MIVVSLQENVLNTASGVLMSVNYLTEHGGEYLEIKTPLFIYAYYPHK